MDNIIKNSKGLLSEAGFTIVELLVAMTLFVTLMSIVSGVFVRSLRTQRATAALIAANSNASLAMEQMSREMRTGSQFSGGGSEIRFTNAKKEKVVYRWNSTSGSVERSNDDGAAFKILTADNVKIKNLFFILFQGPSLADQYPDRITMVLQVGAAGIFIDAPVVNIQTTVSSRVIEI